MSEFDDAMTRLAAAVARLEAAASQPKPRGEDRTAAVAETVTAKLDAALARLGRLLEREE